MLIPFRERRGARRTTLLNLRQSPRRRFRHCAFAVASVFAIAACGGSDSAANPERFCELLDELNAQDTTDLPADEALPIIREGRDKYAESIEVAPEAIKADAETYANGVIQITDLLIAAGGDQFKVDSAALESTSEEVLTEEFDAAVGRVTAWRTSNCT